MRVKCLAQEQIAVPWPGLEPGLFDPKSSALTIRPPHLPQIQLIYRYVDLLGLEMTTFYTMEEEDSENKVEIEQCSYQCFIDVLSYISHDSCTFRIRQQSIEGMPLNNTKQTCRVTNPHNLINQNIENKIFICWN